MALAHGAPGRVSGDCLVDLWRMAAQGKQEARSTAVAAALALMGSTPPPATSATSGASASVVVQAAAEGSAWVRLQKLAAWWLGENINHVSWSWGLKLQHLWWIMPLQWQRLLQTTVLLRLW